MALLFEFDILKTKNEILVSDTKQFIKERFEYLVQLRIEEIVSGIHLRKFLFEAFKDIAVQTAGNPNFAFPLTKAISEMSNHLIGPKDVEIDSYDKRYIRDSLDILETVGSYGVYLVREDAIVSKVCKVMKELGEIAFVYNLKDYPSRASRVLAEFRKEVNQLSTTERHSYNATTKLKIIDQTAKAIENK